jgi:transcription initiation factor TFIID subunit TAF12
MTSSPINIQLKLKYKERMNCCSSALWSTTLAKTRVSTQSNYRRSSITWQLQQERKKKQRHQQQEPHQQQEQERLQRQEQEQLQRQEQEELLPSWRKQTGRERQPGR